MAAGVAALKREDGPELQEHGSGSLVQTLLRHRLVDEWQLLTFPVVLGQGKRLFGDGTVPTALRLVSSSVSGSGVVVSRYVSARRRDDRQLRGGSVTRRILRGPAARAPGHPGRPVSWSGAPQ